MADCHTFVSYFRGFRMSTIPRVFGLQLWNLEPNIMSVYGVRVELNGTSYDSVFTASLLKRW